MNEEISSLMTQFKQNVLKASKEGAVVVDDVRDLDGLSSEQIGAAERAATARGLEGKYLITLQNTTNQPPLARLKNRALRQKIYVASIERCKVSIVCSMRRRLTSYSPASTRSSCG